MQSELMPLDKMTSIANAFVKSGLFGIKTVDQALALMAICESEGIHPARAASDYHIIQGRPALKADAMLARFQQAGGSVDWQKYTDQSVSATFKHPQGGTVSIEWTMERAKQADLGSKDNWKKYPRQMLRARVVSEGIRTVYPGCVVGVYTIEETQDFEPEQKQRKPTKATEVPLESSITESAVLVGQTVIDQFKAQCERYGVKWQDIKDWIKQQYIGKYENTDEAMHVNFDAIMMHIESLANVSA